MDRFGVVAEDDEQFGGGVGADAEAVAQAGRGLCGEPVEFAVMAPATSASRATQRRASARRACLAATVGVSMLPGR